MLVRQANWNLVSAILILSVLERRIVNRELVRAFMSTVITQVLIPVVCERTAPEPLTFGCGSEGTSQ